MTTQAARSQASTALPGMESSATVLEYLCLYTPDLRKKQKKWFDGRLKYHTFNKKVMIYDERSNFIGDTYWREDYDLEEGEEFQTERSNHLVQVAECIGRREQDLTELLDKRLKDKEERRDARAQLPSPLHTPAVTKTLRDASVVDVSQPRLRALSTLLGTPTGHYGRALVSATSPFEDRQRVRQTAISVAAAPATVEQPAKRRKPNSPLTKGGYAQSLTGATLTLSKPPSSVSSSWLRTKVSQNGSVDLTGDAVPPRGEIIKPIERLPREAPAKERSDRPVKKARTEKPERSTYASNLTGAALVFSKPSSSRALPAVSVPSQQMSTNQAAVPKPPQSDALEAEDGFIDIEHFNTQPPLPAKDRRQKRQTAEEHLAPESDAAAMENRKPAQPTKIRTGKNTAIPPPTEPVSTVGKRKKGTAARTSPTPHDLDTKSAATVQPHTKRKKKSTPDAQVIDLETELQVEPNHAKQKPRAKRKDTQEITLASAAEGDFQTLAVNHENRSRELDSHRKQVFSTLRIKARPSRNKLMLMSTPLRRSPAQVDNDQGEDVSRYEGEVDARSVIDDGSGKTRCTLQKPSPPRDDVYKGPAMEKMEKIERDKRKEITERDAYESERMDSMSYHTVDLLLTRNMSENGREALNLEAGDTRIQSTVVSTSFGKSLSRSSPVEAVVEELTSPPEDTLPLELETLAKSPTKFWQTHILSASEKNTPQDKSAYVEEVVTTEITSASSISESEMSSDGGGNGIQGRPTFEDTVIPTDNGINDCIYKASMPTVKDKDKGRGQDNTGPKQPQQTLVDNESPSTNQTQNEAQYVSRKLRIVQPQDVEAREPLHEPMGIEDTYIFNLFRDIGVEEPTEPKAESPQILPLMEFPSDPGSLSTDLHLKILKPQESLGQKSPGPEITSQEVPITGSMLTPVGVSNTNAIRITTDEAAYSKSAEPQISKAPAMKVNPPIRIANPATRGRKAALRSDAAGKAPESIVGPASAMLPPPMPRRPTVNALEMPKDPVFRPLSDYVADKGAWTVEAFDMFDWYPPPRTRL